MGLYSSGRVSFIPIAVSFLVLLCGDAGVAINDAKTARKVLCYHSRCANRTMYDYTINDANNIQPIDWNCYRGNVVLVVNVASF